ncbi:F-box protein skip23 [Rhynchospora pubera]|uniref:F-box protein skip23 n=1 Tax=Rhynchospora pubera TaxID=906938 RepID=A0AAV8BVS6_9POAL|nr:F-box protein skip23 [Rhynchospora pubera]
MDSALVDSGQHCVQDHPLRSQDWSNLQDDIARLIAKKLWFYPHHRKFAAACADWYYISKEVHGPFQQNSIVLLLPYNNQSETCTLYELSDSRTYEFGLSVLRDKFIYGSSNGWVCLSDKEYKISLINLLTMQQFALPYPSYALNFISGMLDTPMIESEIVTKIAVSGSPLSSNGCIIAAIMSTYEELLVCRLGDISWTPIVIKESKLKSHECWQFLHDVIFFQGKIYAINDGYNLLIVDIDGANYVARDTFGPCYQSGDDIGHPSRGEPCIEGLEDLYELRLYLVECYGKLLAIRRFGEEHPDDSYSTQYFELFEFEESEETWRMIHGLGDRSLFVGQNGSISVSATEIPGCRPNCIYFTDDFYRGQVNWEFGFRADNGVFCCEDGSIERFSISHSMARWLVPAMWCQLKM